jgi:hypothetical protein
MRILISLGGMMIVMLAAPRAAIAKIAINTAIIVEVHAPGTAKGMEHGAVTLTRLYSGVKTKETITTPLIKHTELTRLADKEREKIGLKDLKPGMVAVVEIYGDRKDKAPWQLGMLHVLGSAEDADPALAKILSPFDVSFSATVTKVGPPLAERKGDLGQVEAMWGKTPYVFRVTKRTEIVWQATDGKLTPATLDDVKTVTDDVRIHFLSPLATGDPAVAPATRIILDARSKKPR